jgi:hypothetical protein
MMGCVATEHTLEYPPLYTFFPALAELTLLATVFAPVEEVPFAVRLPQPIRVSATYAPTPIYPSSTYSITLLQHFGTSTSSRRGSASTSTSRLLKNSKLFTTESSSLRWGKASFY